MQWSEVRQLHTKLDGAKQTRNEEQKKKGKYDDRNPQSQSLRRGGRGRGFTKDE
jgi:hypothetical protein